MNTNIPVPAGPNEGLAHRTAPSTHTSQHHEGPAFPAPCTRSSTGSLFNWLLYARSRKMSPCRAAESPAKQGDSAAPDAIGGKSGTFVAL